MSFRLWTIFYAFALFAASMATFGPWGIVTAAFVLMFWAWVFYGTRPTLVELLVVVAIIGMVIALLLPAVQSARESSRSGHCRNNLNQLALALLGYESKNGSLPPAYTADADGKPLHSWRMLILPLIERAEIFDKLDPALPWDSSTNRVTSSTEVDLFQCPSDVSQVPPAPDTSYFAVTGLHTAWPNGRARKMTEFTDPKSHTIVLIEVMGKSIPWAQPLDISFDDAVRRLSDPTTLGWQHLYYPQQSGFFTRKFGETQRGIHVAMADGRVCFLALPLPKELAIALLTVDGGEGDIHDQLDNYSLPQLDYARVYVFCVFIILSLLPAASLRRRGA